jgi:hypothetical protein
MLLSLKESTRPKDLMAQQYDPQASLDHIRRLQDRTRDEYVRQGFARPNVVAVAVALFVAIASRDLPGPWDGGVSLLAVGALVGMAIVHARRAPVRRTSSASEVLLLLGAAAALLAALVGFVAAAHALDLPAPYTFAAAALALTSIVVAQWTRRAFAAVVRRQGA